MPTSRSCRAARRAEVDELHAGDIGAVAKLRETFTGDTLGDTGHEIYFDPVTMPEPAVTYAIEPKTRADEDKLAPAVHKLMEEDLMVRFFRDLRPTNSCSPVRASRISSLSSQSCAAATIPR